MEATRAKKREQYSSNGARILTITHPIVTGTGAAPMATAADMTASIATPHTHNDARAPMDASIATPHPHNNATAPMDASIATPHIHNNAAAPMNTSIATPTTHNNAATAIDASIQTPDTTITITLQRPLDSDNNVMFCVPTNSPHNDRFAGLKITVETPGGNENDALALVEQYIYGLTCCLYDRQYQINK